MRAGGSIQKGKQFERDAAKLMEQLTGIKGWSRVPCSGAFSTVHKTNNPVFDGDIFLDVDENNQDPQYKILANYFKNLVVECKIIGTKINLESILSEKSILAEWIKQTEEESKGKDWVLLFRYFGSPTFACSSKEEVLDKLGLLEGNQLCLTVKEKVFFVYTIPLKIYTEKAEHEEANEKGIGGSES